MQNYYPDNTNSDAAQNKKVLDIQNENNYYKNKMEILKTLRQAGLNLSKMYEANIKIEINVNNELGLAKVSVLEFNL